MRTINQLHVTFNFITSNRLADGRERTAGTRNIGNRNLVAAPAVRRVAVPAGAAGRPLQYAMTSLQERLTGLKAGDAHADLEALDRAWAASPGRRKGGRLAVRLDVACVQGRRHAAVLLADPVPLPASAKCHRCGGAIRDTRFSRDPNALTGSADPAGDRLTYHWAPVLVCSAECLTDLSAENARVLTWQNAVKTEMAAWRSERRKLRAAIAAGRLEALRETDFYRYLRKCKPLLPEGSVL